MSDRLQMRQLREVEVNLDLILAEAKQGLIWAIKGEPGRTPEEVVFSFLRTMDNEHHFYGFIPKSPEYQKQVEEIKAAIDWASPITHLIFVYHFKAAS